MTTMTTMTIVKWCNCKFWQIVRYASSIGPNEVKSQKAKNPQSQKAKKPIPFGQLQLQRQSRQRAKFIEQEMIKGVVNGGCVWR